MQQNAGVSAKDQVCGMTTDPGRAGQKVAYQGQTYVFCGPGCRKAPSRRNHRNTSTRATTVDVGRVWEGYDWRADGSSRSVTRTRKNVSQW